jgi:DNA-binding MarR family transcriptional regulator
MTNRLPDLDQGNLKTATQVIKNCARLNRYIVQFNQVQASRHNLTTPQLAVLNSVYIHPNITVRKLAEKMSATNRVDVIADTLAQQNYLEKRVARPDRRDLLLKLTAEGVALVEAIAQEALSYRAFAQALDKMDLSDVDFFLDFSQRLIFRLEEAGENLV